MSLLFYKLLLVSIAHNTYCYFLFKFKYKIKESFLLSFLLSTVCLGINFFTISYNLTTFYVINAAIISFWCIELSILLEKNFWRKVLQNNLPFSINLLLSFVVMINVGYFTMIFIYMIMRTVKLF